jgi:hypothetical protein
MFGKTSILKTKIENRNVKMLNNIDEEIDEEIGVSKRQLSNKATGNWNWQLINILFLSD